MLAQNFKTAADLALSEAEWGAAISVLGMLERGELQHHDGRAKESAYHFEPTVPNGFNMECSGEQTACGTVACIGGWMAIVMGKRDREINSYVNSSPCRDARLSKLFWGVTSRTVTTQQAAIALRSYLTTGDARWDLARADV